MTTLIRVAPNGREHGLTRQVANSVQGDGFSHMPPENKEKAIKKKKEDGKIIKARYLNKNGRNEFLARPYNLGAGEPIQFWTFLHEEVYDVPQGLVNEVNNKKCLARQGKCDENGENPLAKDSYEEQEHRFVPASF